MPKDDYQKEQLNDSSRRERTRLDFESRKNRQDGQHTDRHGKAEKSNNKPGITEVQFLGAHFIGAKYGIKQ